MSGEGGGVKRAALGEIFQAVVDLFALFGFARHFSVSGLNSFFLHSQGSVNIVQLVIEPAGVTDGIAIGISPPQRGGGGLTICTGCARPSCCRLREREGKKAPGIKKIQSAKPLSQQAATG